MPERAADETPLPSRSTRRRSRGSRQPASGEQQAPSGATLSTLDSVPVEAVASENDRETETFVEPPLPSRAVGDGDEDDEADLDDAIASGTSGSSGVEEVDAARLAATLFASENADAEGDAPATGARRRRRRNRGGRSSSTEAEGALVSAMPVDEETPSFSDFEEATPLPNDAPSIDQPAEDESPAVQRRFDRGDWRSRVPGSTSGTSSVGASAAAARATAPRSLSGDLPSRAEPFTAPTQPAVSPATDTDVAVIPTVPAARFSRENTAPVQSSDSAPEKASDDRPSRFNDRSRGRDRNRDRERPAALTFENTTPSADAPAEARPEQASSISPARATASPALTAAPVSTIVTPYSAPPASIVTPSSPLAPARGGEVLDERVERLLANQSLMLAQQQQVLASLTNTMAALQDTLTRLTTSGITANAPRTGVFVDAPNVIYAAENARVTLDYGKMLDFLGRGREIVHAIVYAPVTEDPGSRPENQRFVAPFLRRGYKMVTKPLKRFPDGTAKGNFDIELAIDIMTMSERLDIVVLLSGDSDFARLVQLVQSRGVRVEVASFASNVSWELVQMADVFMDLGQYVREFQET